MSKPRTFGYAAAVVLALGSATGADALTIVLNNTGGVEAGTAAYRGFKVAARFWESVLNDNVTMNLNVGFNSTGFGPTVLGTASSAAGNKTQAAWRAALIGDATTPLDAIATANLANFSNANVRLNTSVQKALGLFTGNLAASDATIRFNSAQSFDFDTRDGFQSIASDFVAVAVHEMGHALGFTSATSEFSTSASRPSNTDMFRYKDGAWDMTWGGNPYFSIDGGATPLFGNSYFTPGDDGRQPSHWRDGARIHDGVSCTQLLEPQIGILDPTGGICQLGIVTANDLALFDAIGWDLNMDILADPNWSMSTAQIMANYAASVPEPATWALMIFGFGTIGSAMRRRPRTVMRIP